MKSRSRTPSRSFASTSMIRTGGFATNSRSCLPLRQLRAHNSRLEFPFHPLFNLLQSFDFFIRLCRCVHQLRESFVRQNIMSVAGPVKVGKSLFTAAIFGFATGASPSLTLRTGSLLTDSDIASNTLEPRLFDHSSSNLGFIDWPGSSDSHSYIRRQQETFLGVSKGLPFISRFIDSRHQLLWSWFDSMLESTIRPRQP